METTKIKLFNDKKECCNCNACINICPQNAIDTYLDEYGFEYPRINNDKCISCGLCKKVCAFQNIKETNFPLETYAAVTKDKNIILKSASGGIFATIAMSYIENNGVVFGAAFDDELNPIHMGITNKELLYKLQGSKYVQSSIGNTYKEAKIALDSGKEVLFCGTPCQIAGLKGYLMKDYENLLTIDIICHGVPSAKFFKDYIRVLEQKVNGKIKEFKFRDKSLSWEKNGSLLYEKDTVLKHKKIYESESSYYYYFSNSDSLRKNCYECKYACENRPGDITIGDYWGIEKVHPELLKKDEFETQKGISVLIINTSKGKDKFIKCKNLCTEISKFDYAKNKNMQLKAPSSKGDSYYEVMETYREKGYVGVERLFKDKVGFIKYKSRIKALVPNNIKRFLKKNL